MDLDSPACSRCFYNLCGWLEAWVNTSVDSSRQCQSGDFHSECSKAAGFELRPGGSLRARWLWWRKESTFHYLKHPLFLRTQAQVPQGWPAFPLTRKWVLEGFLLCLSILPGCGTPANFLTSLVLLVHFNFFLYFLFPIAT